MKILFEVGAKHQCYETHSTDLTWYVWGAMKTTSHKLAFIVCLAPTSKGDFMEKFRRLVVTKLNNYFIPFIAFYFIFEF